MEKYLIHSNELHLIDAEKIHQAVEKMVESLDLAAGSTTNFDINKAIYETFNEKGINFPFPQLTVHQGN